MPEDKPSRTTGFITTRQLKQDYFSQFPQDEELQLQIVDDLISEGYEVEGFNTKFSAFEAMKNIIPSTVDVAKSIVHSVYQNGEFVGDETVKSLGKVALGVLPKNVTTALFGESNSKEFERSFDAMTDFFADRYGGVERIGETVERDPAGFLADLSTFVTGGAGAAKSLAKVGAKSVKSASVSGKISKGAQVAQDIANYIEPTTLATKATFKAIGSLTDKIARRQAREFLGVSPAQARNLSKKTFLGAPPEKAYLELGVAKRLAIKGKAPTIGNVKDELDTIWQESKAKVDNMLADAEKKINRGMFPKAVPQVLRQVIDQFDTIPTQNLSRESLQTIREASTYLNKFNAKGLQLTEINEVKRLLDDVTNVYKKSGEPKDQIKARNFSQLRGELRKFIEDGAKRVGYPQVRLQNNTTAFSKELSNIVTDAINASGKRGRIIETMVGIYGAGSALSSGSLAPLAQALVIIGGFEVMQTPVFRNTMAAVLNAFSDKEIASIERAIQTGRASKDVRRMIRQVGRDLIDLMPEVRAVGVVQEEINQ